MLGGYVALVLLLGVLSRRRSSSSPEEYFLAGRKLGTLVLFMALFGTNATSFVLVGIPGLAYHAGIGTFGLNAPIVALGVPLTFWAIGSPARRMAARLGALTPAELYARRFGSRGLGLLLFLVFTAYTLPYMVQGLKGAALTLEHATGSALPAWAGGLCVIAVALVYTSLGGMRATAWTNVFQGLLFLSFMLAALAFVTISMGGPRAAAQKVMEHDPELLRLGSEGLFEPRRYASWGLVISLTVIAFPHMLARLMSAGSERALRSVSRMYPLALVLLWVPAVAIGVLGAAELPGLEDSDAVLPAMVARHLPALLQPIGVLAVLAAVMSTLDAQLLTLSSMLVRDGLPARSSGEATPRRDVAAARAFTVGLGALVYVLALVWGESVFDISRRAFEGYVTLVPTLLLGVRWRRFTVAGAVASLLAGNAVLLLGWAGRLPTLGFLPVFWALVAGAAAGLVVGALTRPAPGEATERAFGPA